MQIKKCKGCLYGIVDNIDSIFLEKVPNEFKINQEKRDNNKYHITIANSDEINDKLPEDKIIDIKYINLGLSKLQRDNNEVYYLLIYSDDLNLIRKELNLQEIIFHITLGFKFNDIHDKEKSIHNIILKNKIKEEEIVNLKLTKYISDYLKSNYYFPKMLIKELKNNYHQNSDNINYLIENKNYLGYIFRYQKTNDINDLKLAIDNYDYNIHNKYDPKNIGTFNCIK